MNTLVNKVLLTVGAGILFSAIGCRYDKEEVLYPTTIACNNTAAVTFSATVLPILNNSCNGCHGGTAAGGAGIKLDSYANVKTFVTNGALMKSIKHQSGASPMPKNATKLDDCTISKIQKWVDAGANNN